MNFLMRALLSFFAVVTLPLLAATQRRAPQPPGRDELALQARAAYARGDFAGFIERTEKLRRLVPENAATRYNLACGYARAGRPAAALAQLQELADAGLSFALAGDDDLATLRELPAYATLAARMTENGRPRGIAETVFALPAEPLLAEGLAYDPVDKSFFVGSVRHRQILRVTRDGRVAPFTTPGQDGLWGVFALKVDAQRRLLWATSNALPHMEGYSAAEKGRAGLFKFDLSSGKLLRQYLLPGGAAENHNLNDLALNAAGEVWLTDSASPALYRLDPVQDQLLIVTRHPAWVSLQGLAFAPDGRGLFIADYSGGLYRYDLQRRHTALLSHPAGMNLSGIDGLVVHDGRLIAVQNRYAPHRVVRLRLNPSGGRVLALEVLAAALPEFEEPTLGVVVEGEFHFIANSQWGKYRDDGTVAKTPDAVKVMKIKL